MRIFFFFQLCVEELDLFLSCIKWAEAECERRDQLDKNSLIDVKEVLAPILPLIRFGEIVVKGSVFFIFSTKSDYYISASDVATAIFDSGILTSQQLLQIYVYLGCKGKGEERPFFHTVPRCPPVIVCEKIIWAPNGFV